MLKLEKVAKTREINITLRPRTSFFTKSFKEAFLWALGMHLAAGFLFTVQLIRISENIKVFLPAYVESELGSALNNQVIAELEREKIFSHYIGEPPDAKPEFSVFSGGSEVTTSLASLKENSTENPFLKSEFWLMAPELPLLKKSSNLPKPIKIEVSGGLEKYPILKEGWDTIEVSTLKKMKPHGYKASYNVRLDLQTGRLFWIEPLLLDKSKISDLLAEKILAEIQFEVLDSSEAVASGVVEITFLKPEEFND